MTNDQKAIIWKLIEKYDNTLRNMCDSLSRILTGKDTDDDYLEVFKNYRKISYNDEGNIDSIIGNKLFLILN
jgi:hypothetical protein